MGSQTECIVPREPANVFSSPHIVDPERSPARASEPFDISEIECLRGCIVSSIDHEDVCPLRRPSDEVSRCACGGCWSRWCEGGSRSSDDRILMEGEELFVLDNSKLFVREFTQLG